MTVKAFAQKDQSQLEHYRERCELACAFRWAVRHDFHEAAANHFSLAVSEDGSQFLINPNGTHFSRVKASNIILCHANDPDTMKRPDAPDPSAWGLHGSLHRNLPHARCILHVHSTYATVLASLQDSLMQPIDQNTARFFNRVVVDEGFGGMAFQEEGERVCGLMQDKRIMVMGNHGLMVIAPSVAQAYDEMYYFERAAKNYVLALMTQKPMRVLSDEIAEKTARQWENYPNAAANHFRELIAILDETEPDYKD